MSVSMRVNERERDSGGVFKGSLIEQIEGGGVAGTKARGGREKLKGDTGVANKKPRRRGAVERRRDEEGEEAGVGREGRVGNVDGGGVGGWVGVEKKDVDGGERGGGAEKTREVGRKGGMDRLQVDGGGKGGKRGGEELTV